jgi:hypothetical protein
MPAPKELQPIIDQLVASVHDNASQPSDIQKLYEWLELDGWDELMSDLDDGLAVNVGSVASRFFEDADLIAKSDPSLGRITDSKRVAHARGQIKRVIESDGGDLFVTIHAYPLVDSKGRTAVLGCLVEVHGQGGPVAFWRQPVPGREQLIIESFHREHVWLHDEIDSLPDSYLLFMWQTKEQTACH